MCKIEEKLAYKWKLLELEICTLNVVQENVKLSDQFCQLNNTLDNYWFFSKNYAHLKEEGQDEEFKTPAIIQS